MIEKLTLLQQRLLKIDSIEEKISLLDSLEDVKLFLKRGNLPLSELSKEHQYLIKAVIAIGQEAALYAESITPFSLQKLADKLLAVERFYDVIGGVIGYHLTLLQLLEKRVEPLQKSYRSPPLIDICLRNEDVDHSIIYAIEHLDQIGEIYVVGGAGDRLDLRDPATKKPLPAALLKFQGATLLEGLIRDTQAREYLHYKLFGKQITVAIAMMTSQEKENHQHILQICEKNRWFGRGEENFTLFTQPLAPVVTRQGEWVLNSPLDPVMKPGGHGALWKLAKDHAVFDWFEERGYKKVLVRQINNPVACIDYGVLSFLGFGLLQDRAFGMASCDRVICRPEGMSVLVQAQTEKGFSYCISNIEYTEFDKKGIQDSAKEIGSNLSKFPANTNILFADIRVVRHLASTSPLPGLLVNMKPLSTCTDIAVGRLETTMQNIADYIVDHTFLPYPPAHLKTFATYYERRKTLSPTKESLQDRQGSAGSPQACYYDMLCNYRELLQEHCSWSLPPLSEDSVYGLPPFLIYLHPALGPIFEIIGQKLRIGTMIKGSELRIEAAEIDIEKIYLEGSLQILCDQITGHKDPSNCHTYSERVGRCTLKNVSILNAGVDYESSRDFWAGEVVHRESLQIHLKGNSEFYAEDVTFKGDIAITVAEGERVVARHTEQGAILLESYPLDTPSWSWHYTVLENKIALEKRGNDTCLTAVEQAKCKSDIA